MPNDFLTALAAEVRALEEELEQSSTYRRLQRAKALLAEYRGEKTITAMQQGNFGPINILSAGKVTPAKRQRTETTQGILTAVADMLRGSEEPMRTSNLLAMLRERGFEIPGEKALNNLSAMISYSKMFQAHGRSGWTLIDAVAASRDTEAVDDPNLPGQTSTTSAEHRLTSGGTTSMPVKPRLGGGT